MKFIYILNMYQRPIWSISYQSVSHTIEKLERLPKGETGGYRAAQPKGVLPITAF